MELDAPSRKVLTGSASRDGTTAAAFGHAVPVHAIGTALLKGTASVVPQASSTTLRLQPLRYAFVALLATGAAGAVLRAFPPETSAFFPACPFYEWTGLLCPGCGGTRALAALAHGHLTEAIRWNGLIVALIAAGAAWLAWACVRASLQPAAPQPIWPHVPSQIMIALGAAMLLFAVVRNLS